MDMAPSFPHQFSSSPYTPGANFGHGLFISYNLQPKIAHLPSPHHSPQCSRITRPNNRYSWSGRITSPRTGLIEKMAEGSSGAALWARLLVALTHIVAISSQPQFSYDSKSPIVTDISATIRNYSTPSFDGVVDTLSPVIMEQQGLHMVTGTITVGTHIGTHIVSRGHYSTYHGNFTVEMVNLRSLIGPVLVVDTPRNTNITAQVLQSLNLPVGLKRVIFRTSNTDRKLVNPPPLELNQAPAFVSDYTGLTADGAAWLAQNTTIQFVGIDYISVGMHAEKVAVYENLFANKEIIPVEYLKLDEVNPGNYTVYCLPLRVEAEGSPARCILVE